MIIKADKYYNLLKTIREVRKELQLNTISLEDKKKKIGTVVQAYRALGDLDNCAAFLDSVINEDAVDEELVDAFIRIKEISGRTHVRKGELGEALKDFESALNMAEKYDMDYKIMDMCQSLSNIYEKKGDYRRALIYYNQYSRLSDDTYRAKNYAYSKYLLEVYGLDEISEETRRMVQKNRDLGLRVNIDSLMGIYNRRFLHDALTEALMEERNTCRICVIMMDIDFFKQYNDTYGHVAGDEVLRNVGGILRRYAGDRVYPIRYGGEEFMVVINDPAPGEGSRLTENIMGALREKKIEHKASKADSIVTLSAGIADGICSSYDDIYRLSEAADRLLYEAKRQGRNRWLEE